MRPVIIGNATPWRGLVEKGAGWDVALDDTNALTAAVQGCVDADQGAMARLSAGALACATEHSAGAAVDKTRQLLSTCLGGQS